MDENKDTYSNIEGNDYSSDWDYVSTPKSKDKSKKAAFKNGLPYSGAWILPSVLNKDIVLIWRRWKLRQDYKS